MTGLSAPEFAIAAVGSGRLISRSRVDGRPLVLLFHDQSGEETVRTIQESLRARWPLASTLVVASVVNMSAIPGFLHSAARGVIERAYRQGARLLPSGLEPADYIVILLDEKGALYRDCGVAGSGRPPVAIVIDGDWSVVGRFSGTGIVADTSACVAALLAGSTASG
jgi:hypothetical protein